MKDDGFIDWWNEYSRKTVGYPAVASLTVVDAYQAGRKLGEQVARLKTMADQVFTGFEESKDRMAANGEILSGDGVHDPIVSGTFSKAIAPEPERLGIIEIDPRLMHKLLQLPSNLRIETMRWDDYGNRLLVRVTGEGAPPHAPDSAIVRMNPVYEDIRIMRFVKIA